MGCVHEAQAVTPHRGGLMTGKYLFSIGLWTNCKIGLEEKLIRKPQEICMGNVFKDGVENVCDN